MEARVLPPPLRSPDDDPETYPAHEEDDVPQNVVHDDIGHYLRGALAAHVRDGWVAGDVCCYWIPGDRQTYLAPDVFLVDGPRPDPTPKLYLNWMHGPMRLAVEIGSRQSYRVDEEPKLARYAEGLWPREYLYFNPASGDLRLFRLIEQEYVRVEPDERGWVRSEEARLWFGAERDDFLRAYDDTGAPLRTHLEEVEQRIEAERRVAELEAELARLREQPSG